MSNSISTLLLRNLREVFGENDPERRRAAIDEIFHEDAVFYDPKGGAFRGRDEIDHIAGVIKATHPDFEYQPLSPPEELGDAGRVRWVSGTPGKPPLRGNRFCRRPGGSHCFGLSLFRQATLSWTSAMFGVHCPDSGSSASMSPATSDQIARSVHLETDVGALESNESCPAERIGTWRTLL